MGHCIPVNGKKRVSLSEATTKAPDRLKREDAEKRAGELGKRLSELADLQFFAGQTPLLIVLQGMDTSGKDGTIRFLLSHLNAQSVDVSPFKVPSDEERSHDFLWRIHHHTPPRGGITIFNRSHYEDVLVVRVHNLASESKWRKRYDHIRAFESLLADNDTKIAKFFLHISKAEQEKRLLEREEETEKAWKLSVGDWKERERWDDYQQAYEDALNATGTDECPWHIVPADQKWFRNLAIAEALVDLLEPLEADWLKSLEALGDKAKAELKAFRAALHAPTA